MFVHAHDLYIDDFQMPNCNLYPELWHHSHPAYSPNANYILVTVLGFRDDIRNWRRQVPAFMEPAVLQGRNNYYELHHIMVMGQIDSL